MPQPPEDNATGTRMSLIKLAAHVEGASVEGAG